METRAHYVAVGTFVLVLVTVAFAAVLWLARAQLSTQYTAYDIFFTGPVSGLREGATVEYSGVPSGRVKEIRIDPKNVEEIRVTVEIESNVVIKQNASCRFAPACAGWWQGAGSAAARVCSCAWPAACASA